MDRAEQELHRERKLLEQERRRQVVETQLYILYSNVEVEAEPENELEVKATREDQVVVQV